MVANTLMEATLFIAIPDDASREAAIAALPPCYAVTEFVDLKSLTSSLVQKPNLIICHQCLIEENQATLLAQIQRQIGPGGSILIIGPSRPISIQIQALKHGARGYFDESLPRDRLHDALQLIMQGEVWVERHAISGLIDELTQAPAVSDEQRQMLESLSPKETEVAQLVSEGATNKMIARAMNITERTVKAHLTTIFQKLNLPDRLSLAIFFRDLR